MIRGEAKQELYRSGVDSLACGPMGQPVAVVEKQSATPGVVRFEANRSLTGMGHERFASKVDAYESTSSAELARRLFDTGRVASVHVYANIITVNLNKGFDSAGLSNVIEGLYTFWTPGKVPPSPEELMAEMPGGGAGGDVAPPRSEPALLSPTHASRPRCSPAARQRSPSGRTTRRQPNSPAFRAEALRRRTPPPPSAGERLQRDCRDRGWQTTGGDSPATWKPDPGRRMPSRERRRRRARWPAAAGFRYR